MWPKLWLAEKKIISNVKRSHIYVSHFPWQPLLHALDWTKNTINVIGVHNSVHTGNVKPHPEDPTSSVTHLFNGVLAPSHFPMENRHEAAVVAGSLEWKRKILNGYCHRSVECPKRLQRVKCLKWICSESVVSKKTTSVENDDTRSAIQMNMLATH